MQRPDKKRIRPRQETDSQKSTTATGSLDSLTASADLLADLDALAESLRGYLVVQVTVDDEGHRRTFPYRSAAAAQRCVERARDRGRTGHVTLVQMLPVGVVVGLGGGR